MIGVSTDIHTVIPSPPSPPSPPLFSPPSPPSPPLPSSPWYISYRVRA